MFNRFLFTFEVPCVGVSIGIERIFSILEARAEVTYDPGGGGDSHIK